MADEIRVQSTLKVVNGSFKGTWTNSFRADQTNTGGGNPGTVDLTTSEEAIDTGEITTVGWTWIQNIGDTNAAEVGFETPFTVGMTIDPGETAGPFKLISGTTIYAKAAASTTTIQVIVLEE